MPVGEFELIDFIRKKFAPSKKRGAVVLGVGDDAAALRLAGDKLLLVTTDTVVEDVHFKLRYFTYEQVGHRIMAANLSDIAAMGGWPTYYLVTIGLPKGTTQKNVDAIYRGMERLARKHRVALIGGDIVRAEKLFVTVTLLGEVERKNLLTRSGAHRGNLVCVTGHLGASLLGFRLLNQKSAKRVPHRLTRRHLQPEARLAEARWIVQNLRPTAMIDISDGLSSELNHLARESRVGFAVEAGKIPVPPGVRRAIGNLKGNWVDYALASGEEYELLFTVPKSQVARLKNWPKHLAPVSVIGRVAAKGVVLIGPEGRVEKIRPSGWRHL